MASSETNNIILFMKNYNFTTTIAGKIVPITIMNFAPYFCTKIPLGISDTMFPMKHGLEFSTDKCVSKKRIE